MTTGNTDATNALKDHTMTDEQIEGRTERQTNTQIYRQRDRQIDRQTGKQSGETGNQTDGCTFLQTHSSRRYAMLSGGRTDGPSYTHRKKSCLSCEKFARTTARERALAERRSPETAIRSARRLLSADLSFGDS